MKSNLQLILDLSYAYSKINRDIYYPDRLPPENDAEHSFQMVLLAWHIMETDGLQLDALKVFKLCIAHDLVEIYSGDVPLWGTTGHQEKEAKEKEALGVLKDKLGDAREMTDAVAEYKERKTDEAKFVYGIDKLAPFLTQMNTEGRIWKSHNVTPEKALEVLEKHAKVSGHLVKYFDEGITYLKENKERLFS